MTVPTLLRSALLVATCTLPPNVLPAQWKVGAEIAALRFWGGAEEIGPVQRSLRPYRPTILGLGLERRRGGVGAALWLRYGESSLALEGTDAVAAVKGALTVYGAWAELSATVAGLGAGSELRVYAGPLVEIWELAEETRHLRLGGEGAVGLEIPLGSRVRGVLRAGAAVTPASVFAREDLEPEFEPKALWRRGVAASLQYRL